VHVSTGNRAAVRGAGIVIVAVKPTTVAEVLDEIRPGLKRGALVVSVAASVPTKVIEQHLPKGTPVVRAMPNTPAVVGSGMTALASGSRAKAEHLALAKTMFEAVGRAIVL